MSLSDAIAAAASRQEVSAEILEAAFGTIMDGQASEAEIAGLLVALRTKGETVSEIIAAARACRARADTAPLPIADAVDTCGTGGDGASTFNISTVAAFVVAGAGVTVVKHGNRAASSRSGSYDVLEAFGVHADLPVARAAAIAGEIGIAFFFARRAHPAMRHMAPIRQQLRIRTIMNCLGPILNPVGVRRQLIGVYDPDLVPAIASALRGLGSERALVVHGSDGLDELTTTGGSTAMLWDGESEREYEIHPEQVGLSVAASADLRGGEPEDNARIGHAILAGESGAPRDIVLLNAAGALWASGRAADLAEGVSMAAKSIDSGAAREKLAALVDRTQREVSEE